MVDYSQAAMLLGRVGLALPVVDMDRLTVHYSELSSLVSDLRDLGLTNTLAARETRPLTRRWREALQASYKTHFARGDGKLKASFEIVWMTGWAPHGSQQKPLKPACGDVLGHHNADGWLWAAFETSGAASRFSRPSRAALPNYPPPYGTSHSH